MSRSRNVILRWVVGVLGAAVLLLVGSSLTGPAAGASEAATEDRIATDADADTGPAAGAQASEAFTCVVDGDAGLVTWTDQGASTYFVRHHVGTSDTYLGSSTTLSFPMSRTDGQYIVRATVDGTPIFTACNAPDYEPFRCWIDAASRTLMWNDVKEIGADRIEVLDSDGDTERLGRFVPSPMTGIDPGLRYRVEVTDLLTAEDHVAHCGPSPDPVTGPLACAILDASVIVSGDPGTSFRHRPLNNGGTPGPWTTETGHVGTVSTRTAVTDSVEVEMLGSGATAVCRTLGDEFFTCSVDMDLLTLSQNAPETVTEPFDFVVLADGEPTRLQSSTDVTIDLLDIGALVRPGVDLTLRIFRYGTVDLPCSTGVDASMTCLVDGPAQQVQWTDRGTARYLVSHRFAERPFDPFGFVDSVSTRLFTSTIDLSGWYLVDAVDDGEVVARAMCEGPGYPPFTCAVDTAAGTISFSDQGDGPYFIRQVIGDDDTYLGSTEGRSFPIPDARGYFIVRHFVPVQIEARCVADTPVFGCTVDAATRTLAWDDNRVRFVSRITVEDTDTAVVISGANTSPIVGVDPTLVYRVRVFDEVAGDFATGTCGGIADLGSGLDCALIPGGGLVVAGADGAALQYRALNNGGAPGPTVPFGGRATAVHRSIALADTVEVTVAGSGDTARCRAVGDAFFTCSIDFDTLTGTHNGAETLPPVGTVGLHLDNLTYLGPFPVEDGTFDLLAGRAHTPSLDVPYRLIVAYNGSAAVRCSFDVPPSLTCAVSAATGAISWNDRGLTSYDVSVDGTPLGSTSATELALTDLRGRFLVTGDTGAEIVRAVCDGPGNPPFACSIDDADGVLSWTLHGDATFHISRVAGGERRYLGSTTDYSFPIPNPSGTYTVRFLDKPTNVYVEASCDADPGMPFVCSVDAATSTLSWSDAGADTYYVRHRNIGMDRYIEATDQTAVAVGVLDGTHVVRHYRYGTVTEATCETAAPTFTCTIDGGTATLSWTDRGAARYHVRRLDAGGSSTYVAATTATSFVVSDPAATYVVRFHAGGRTAEATCAPGGSPTAAGSRTLA